MSSDLQGVLLSPWALGLLGLCIGSFLNVVIHRLPQMMERAWRLESAELLGVTAPESPALTLAKPASRCPQCGHRIRWFENVPVLSWLLLRGRCSACKTPISPRYPLFEIATGLLFASLAWRFGAQPTVLAWCAFVAVLLALSGIDWDTTLLPDSLTLPLLWAGLVAAALGWTLPLSTSVWGAVFGYLSLWSVYWLFKLTTGKEGMGAGDFKLLAALGAWLGWQMLLPIVLGASLIGAIVGIAMKLAGALHEGRYVPFGPFLAGAGLVVLYAGAERVMGWLGWA
ncbi:MAG: A24 family peptidase [Methylibium sp.]|uniref:Prepilin leader peptidase/N-methyltransferase n=1 Tax=Methylibium petroleiphilum (strain ATCC BAA-1232 / LMG 22953 / PM1) TaxID=420662 RepID=A2SD30_METPP|nr:MULTISPECIES: A24 family peptidase [Methylibium]ABM93469.1 signal peptidase [Methylibium petroleiphilum PM1]EWS61648.1 Pectic enzymes secretion protein OutO [Methylibium sp. T29-B]